MPARPYIVCFSIFRRLFCPSTGRLTVRQQVDDLVLPQIDQDGAVMMATPPSPVVDPQYARRARLGFAGHGGGGGYGSQQRIGTGWQTEPDGKPCAGFTTGCEAEVAVQIERRFVRRADPRATSPSRSAKVLRAQAGLRQRKRWTRRFILMWRGLDDHVVGRRQHVQNLQRAGNKGDQGGKHERRHHNMLRSKA